MTQAFDSKSSGGVPVTAVEEPPSPAERSGQSANLRLPECCDCLCEVGRDAQRACR